MYNVFLSFYIFKHSNEYVFLVSLAFGVLENFYSPFLYSFKGGVFYNLRCAAGNKGYKLYRVQIADGVNIRLVIENNYVADTNEIEYPFLSDNVGGTYEKIHYYPPSDILRQHMRKGAVVIVVYKLVKTARITVYVTAFTSRQVLVGQSFAVSAFPFTAAGQNRSVSVCHKIISFR